MRTTLIALLIVVAAAIALCAFAQARVCGLVEEMDELRFWRKRSCAPETRRPPWNALPPLPRAGRKRARPWRCSPPDHLHEVYADVVDARVCLEQGDYDDCYRALAQLGEALRHIGEMEAVSFQPL